MICYFYCFLFIKDWAGLDSMMSDSRSSKLQTLQQLEEMQEFLDFIEKEGKTISIFALIKSCF